MPLHTTTTAASQAAPRAGAAVRGAFRPFFRTWPFRVGIVLALAGVAMPHRSVAAAVEQAGGASDLAQGFLLLRVMLVLTGTLLVAAARWSIGVSSTGVTRLTAAAPASRAQTLVVAGLIMLAAGLRLPGLNADFWLDEMLTVHGFVRAPLVWLMTSFESQNNHPLYSLMAKAAATAFSESPAVVRLPALAFGVAGIAALYWFGAQVTSRREAILATALLSVSWHHVWFSQNARAYSALLFLSLVGTGLFLRLCRQSDHTRGTALAYAGTMTLAVYAHMTAALVVIGHFLVWLVAIVPDGRWRQAWRSAPTLAVVLAGMWSLMLYAPGLAHIVTGLDGGGEQVDMVWKNPIWMMTEMIRGLARGVPGGIPVLALGAAVPLAGFASYLGRDRVATGLLVVPVLLTAGMLIASGHNLWPRFFFFAAGFALLILVRGIFALAALQRVVPSDALATVIAVLIAAGSAATVPSAWGPKQDFAAPLAYVQGTREPGDAIAVTGVTDWVYHDFLQTDWSTVGDAGELEALVSSHRRTMLVIAMPELIAARSPDLWRAIEEQFRPMTAFHGTLAGGTVQIMVNE